MAMTSTGCAGTRPSSWRADGCRTPAVIFGSQPTISRWENAPTLREIIRLTLRSGRYLVPKLPEATSVCCLLSHTVDVVHGHQQFAQWTPTTTSAASCRSMSMMRRRVLRLRHPASWQDAVGVEVRKLLSRLIGAHPPALAQHLHHHPRRRPLRPRGDGRGARPTASTTFSGSPAMLCSTAWSKPPPTISACRRAESQAEVLRGFAEHALRGQVVGQGAAGRSPDRGQRQPRR